MEQYCQSKTRLASKHKLNQGAEKTAFEGCLLILDFFLKEPDNTFFE